MTNAWSTRKLNIDALWRYASIDRMENVMRPYLESITTYVEV